MRLLNITEIHADHLLSELAMSHRDLEQLLRSSLNTLHPEADTYVWPRDVYDDYLVYSLETSGSETLLQRDYAVNEFGEVSFGDAVEVVATTQYVAVDNGLDEASDTFVEAVSGIVAWLKKHGGAHPHSACTAKFGNAAMCAKAVDKLKGSTKWRGAKKESAVEEIISDLVPLVEKAVKKDGTISIKVIAPGQGSSGYYSPEVLKRDGPNVFKKGLHVYADHPSLSEESDRPERSIKDLIGALTTDAVWQDEGAAGPGLYAEAKLRSDVAPLIEDLAPHIGMSIRALGKAEAGEVDGKATRVITAIEQARSCDVVTVPGAGGRVLELMEAARQGMTPPPVTSSQEDEKMENDLKEAQATIVEQRKELDDLKEWKLGIEQRERETALLAEARAVIDATLEETKLGETSRKRLASLLIVNVPRKDDALDRDALVAETKRVAEEEAQYIASFAKSDAGTIKGMGESSVSNDVPNLEESDKRLAAAMSQF